MYFISSQDENPTVFVVFLSPSARILTRILTLRRNNDAFLRRGRCDVAQLRFESTFAPLPFGAYAVGDCCFGKGGKEVEKMKPPYLVISSPVIC